MPSCKVASRRSLNHSRSVSSAIAAENARPSRSSPSRSASSARPRSSRQCCFWRASHAASAMVRASPFATCMASVNAGASSMNAIASCAQRKRVRSASAARFEYATIAASMVCASTARRPLSASTSSGPAMRCVESAQKPVARQKVDRARSNSTKVRASRGSVVASSLTNTVSASLNARVIR